MSVLDFVGIGMVWWKEYITSEVDVEVSHMPKPVNFLFPYNEHVANAMSTCLLPCF